MRIRKTLPRYMAVHEAGHAIAHWYTGTLFLGVFLRTPQEVLAGPYIDRKGHECDCFGGVESPSRAEPKGRMLGKDDWHIDEITLGDQNGDSKSSNELAKLKAIMRSEMEIGVITFLSGPIAQARFSHESIAAAYIGGGRSDIEEIRARINDFCRSEQEDSELWNRLEKRTCAMLREPRVWEAVLAVADKLRQRGRLEYEETLAIIERVTGQGERPSDYLYPQSLKSA